MCIRAALLILITSLSAQVQVSRPSKASAIPVPKGSLWSKYSYQLQAAGQGPFHWHVYSGLLPKGVQLRDNGELYGVIDQTGEFDFIAEAQGPSGKPERSLVTLVVEPPLISEWQKQASISGNRIDGSVKVSNTTGRDLDLTFDVLAVNEIGRATAIGYQHFALKKDTRDLELPFGDTLGPGSYVVHIDVVGEEPVSKSIFRSRLVTPKQTIAPTL